MEQDIINQWYTFFVLWLRYGYVLKISVKFRRHHLSELLDRYNFLTEMSHATLNNDSQVH